MQSLESESSTWTWASLTLAIARERCPPREGVSETKERGVNEDVRDLARGIEAQSA